MTNEEMAVGLAEHGKEIGSLKHRMENCENEQKATSNLVHAVDKLAGNMGRMLDEQKEQGKRLLKLEQAPTEDYRYYKRLIVGCVVTTIIGIVIGAVFALILK